MHHLGVNERQEGLWWSSSLVRGMMTGDRGHLWTMWLLPFIAAAIAAV